MPTEHTIEAEELAALPMHAEKTISSCLHVERVPGGWIYKYFQAHGLVSAAFVPLPKAIMVKLGA